MEQSLDIQTKGIIHHFHIAHNTPCLSADADYLEMILKRAGGGGCIGHQLLMAFSFRITPLVQEIFYNRCTYVSLKDWINSLYLSLSSSMIIIIIVNTLLF